MRIVVIALTSTLVASASAGGSSWRPIDLKTSDPPKRRLSFQLEETRYVALVTLKGAQGRVIPARVD